jgi:hypothetical protein
MATHGEIRWPPVGTFNGRLWGDFHGRRQRVLHLLNPPAAAARSIPREASYHFEISSYCVATIAYLPCKPHTFGILLNA